MLSTLCFLFYRSIKSGQRILLSHLADLMGNLISFLYEYGICLGFLVLPAWPYLHCDGVFRDGILVQRPRRPLQDHLLFSYLHNCAISSFDLLACWVELAARQLRPKACFGLLSRMSTYRECRRFIALGDSHVASRPNFPGPFLRVVTFSFSPRCRTSRKAGSSCHGWRWLG